MHQHRLLISELEDAVRRGSPEKRVETLKRVTDLFLGGCERLTEVQIQVFDDVLGHLITRMESKALVELSERLAPINNAPINVVHTLARDDEIAIAGPVLSLSDRLTTPISSKLRWRKASPICWQSPSEAASASPHRNLDRAWGSAGAQQACR